MKKLGVDQLHPEQVAPMKAINAGDDTIVVLRTGGGKSILFQAPALADDESAVTVVFSPLIALQQDQVGALRKRLKEADLEGVVFCLNSTMGREERKRALEAITNGKVKLLYIAPEQLANTETVAALEKAHISRVVVDEAHILVQDTEGFRPAYGQIGQWVKGLNQKPQILAFSATLTKKELSALDVALCMDTPKVFRFPVRRKNLKLYAKSIQVNGKSDKVAALFRLRMQAVERELSEWNGKGSAIIYCPTISMVKKTTKWLKGGEWSVAQYHGKRTAKQREKAMSKFLSGKRTIMVATSAFGLGVDKPDVRLVIHAAPPLSLDGYTQEIGRAGRDGKKARCVLFYASQDWNLCAQTVRHGTPKKAKNKGLKRLEKLKELVRKGRLRWKEIEHHFGVK